MKWNDEEFTVVFHEMYPGLVRFLRGVSGDESLAQEFAAEAFLRLFRASPADVPPDAIRNWLFRVGRNLSLNELGRRERWRRVSGMLRHMTGGGPSSPEAEGMRRERAAQRWRLLDALPEHQRSALLLRECEGLGYAEIARVLVVSVSKVKVDIHRARMALRRRWAERAGAGRRGSLP